MANNAHQAMQSMFDVFRGRNCGIEDVESDPLVPRSSGGNVAAAGAASIDLANSSHYDLLCAPHSPACPGLAARALAPSLATVTQVRTGLASGFHWNSQDIPWRVGRRRY